MAEPVVFIVRHKVKQGRAAESRVHYEGSVPRTLAEKPGTAVQLAYEDDDASQVTIVRVFPDADAFDKQLEGAEARSRTSYEFIEPLGVEIYGRPNTGTMGRMKKMEESGVRVEVYPGYIGGFIR
jgi:quinol monooxygenase YgiN